MVSRQCVSSYASSYSLVEKNVYHTPHISMDALQYANADVFSIHPVEKTSSHTPYTYTRKVELQYGFDHDGLGHTGT